MQEFGVLSVQPVQVMTEILVAVERALKDEGVSETTIRRVRNRLVWGNPDGANAVIRVNRDDIERATKTLCL